MRKLTGNTTLTNVTIADENLNETADFRLDSLTALAVAMNARLALKVSLQFLFDNQPSFIERPWSFRQGTRSIYSCPFLRTSWTRFSPSHWW